ncbi:Peptidase A24A, prepilin type IV [Rhodococcus sp. AW25M09]|uniref:prepilin peptidase n=1 Tax=Rhodococcus sp. AW25M09 TaxID=1268303 RepID=UPI0002ACBB04|nr:A24 family peptidase [Rhodococcus sp. AW25M09]CCQ16609.1 Peptidase A24A, prepilin type IV [Rhodococcus sp. AW25M09]
MLSLCVAVLVGGVAGLVMRGALVEWSPRWLPLLSAVGTGWVWWRFGGSEYAVPLCAATWWFAALSAVDLGRHRLPNGLTIPGALVVTVALAWTGCADSLLGGALLFVMYLVVHLLAPAAFGAGDVKLAWSVGSIASLGGGEGWAIAALSAPLATAVVGSVAAAFGHGRARIAHGPSMCAATLLASAACLT